MAGKYPALIALGANLGKPRETFARALDAISSDADVLAVSGLWASPAWPPGSGAPDYVNAVAGVRTDLTAEAMLDRLHAIEAAEGRVRNERNAPRTLDLDLLDHAGAVRAGGPVLPHPRLQDRAFVLLPLWEVAPDWTHPVTGRGVWEMMGRLPDVSGMRRLR